MPKKLKNVLEELRDGFDGSERCKQLIERALLEIRIQTLEEVIRFGEQWDPPLELGAVSADKLDMNTKQALMGFARTVCKASVQGFVDQLRINRDETRTAQSVM